MNGTAQDYQKLLTEAIQKQMLILGPQVTLRKARDIPGLTVTDDGRVTGLSENQPEIVRRFLEQFRDISSPLVKKTMQPLLSTITTEAAPKQKEQTTPANSINQIQPDTQVKK